MTSFASYKDAYRFIRLERTDGILEMTFHTEGGPLRWGHIGGAHEEISKVFGDVSRDAENVVVIMTGTGDLFSGPPADPGAFPEGDAASWEPIRFNAHQLTNSLLDIPAPVISVLNGPAYRHPELPLLGDIVLAADDALVQDTAHFTNRLTPGDGVNLFFPLLMGWNRGRYFLLTGQTLDAQELLRLGLVNEVMPREKLRPRAWQLARQLRQQNPLVLRYTRMLFTKPLKAMVQQYLDEGLALEGLAAAHETALRKRLLSEGSS